MVGIVNIEYILVYSVSNKLIFELFFLNFLTTLSNGDALVYEAYVCILVMY